MDSVGPVVVIRKTRKKARAIMTAILALFIVPVLAIPAVAGYVGWQVSHPEREAIATVPEQYGLPKQDIEFRSRFDQLLLKGWIIPAEDKKRIVIFAHGYADNRSMNKPALPTAKALYDQGISSLLFDFHNSGESEKSVTSVGQLEKEDLLSAIDYAGSAGYEEIGLIGFSMGAAAALMAAPDDARVKFVVADSPFADLEAYLQDNLSIWSGLPDFPFTPLIMWEIPLLTGIDPGKVKPIEAIRQLRDRPVLLIHEEGDPKISSENSKQLYEASGSGKTQLWITPGAQHVGSYEFDPQQYIRKVTGFVVQHM